MFGGSIIIMSSPSALTEMHSKTHRLVARTTRAYISSSALFDGTRCRRRRWRDRRPARPPPLIECTHNVLIITCTINCAHSCRVSQPTCAYVYYYDFDLWKWFFCCSYVSISSGFSNALRCVYDGCDDLWMAGGGKHASHWLPHTHCVRSEIMIPSGCPSTDGAGTKCRSARCRGGHNEINFAIVERCECCGSKSVEVLYISIDQKV